MKTDKFGVQFSDDGKTLMKCPADFKGEYSVPNDVTSIGREAFMGCTKLKSVTIPDSVTSIGSGAFHGCEKLKSFTLPDSVIEIGTSAFAGCRGLTSAVCNKHIFAYVSHLDSEVYTIPDGITTVVGGAFYNCSGLRAVIVPNSVTSMGAYVFNKWSQLAPVYNDHTFFYLPKSYSGAYTIPKGITTIQDYACEGCLKLVAVTIGKGVKTIGSHAFYNCCFLEDVHLPEGLTTIGDHAFYDSSIKSIDIPDSVTEIGDQAFGTCHYLTSIRVPDSVTRIGDCAFNLCNALKFIHIGKGVQTIGVAAFGNYIGYTSVVETITVDLANPCYDCRNNCHAIIETKTNTLIAGCNNTKIPDDIEHIASEAFSGCAEIEQMELPKGVKTIGRKAFSSCTKLATITVPDSLTEIGDEAFWECEKLQSVTIPNGVSKIGKEAFKRCNSLTSISLPESVQSIGEEAFYGCASLRSVTIAEGVTSIADHAFDGCEKLISIVIPTSVKVVGWYAFNECRALSAVVFCGEIEKIGKTAFAKCTCLAKIIVPPGTKEHYVKLFQDAEMPSLSKKIREGDSSAITAVLIQEDGDLVFEDDAKTILHACQKTATAIVIPETVKKINPDAFVECTELTSVTIGFGAKSVRSINNKLFRKCKNLTHLVLGDSITGIGVEAFAYDGFHSTGNPNLQSITIPVSLKKIGYHAFYYCDKLAEVHIADMTAWCNIDFNGADTNPLNRAHHLYLGDEEIHDLVIPEAVTRIQKRLFFGCEGFTSVTIPNTVTEIGAEAFKGCTGLKTVIIPESVNKIGRDAFDGTVHIIYRGSAQWEEDNLWWGARCMNGYVDGDLIYDSEKRTILYGCLKSDIGDVVLPDSVNKIGGRAFQRCSGLTSIMLSESVKEIGVKAFEGCSSLKFITIPEGVLEIGRATFKGCTNLSSVTIPDSATCWDFEIFRNCENLQKVRIPEGVEGIDNFAFGGCARLTEITIPKSVKYFNNWAFHSCAGLETIIFQGQVELCYWCLFGCNNLKHIIIPKGTKDHFLQQDKNTDLGIKNFAELLEEEGTHVAEQQQEVIILLTMAQGFDKGIGVPKNGEMAISLYKQAAEKGSAEAAYRLGVCYRDGEYVAQDKDAALTYFRQAAETKYKDSDEQVANLQK